MTATASIDPTSARIALTVGGKVYGPYAYPQIAEYVIEGRVTAASLVSRNGGPWTQASLDPLCGKLFNRPAPGEPAMAEPAMAATAVAAPEPATPAPVAAPVRTRNGYAEPGAQLSAREAFLKELEGVSRIRNSAFGSEDRISDRRQNDRRVSDASIVAAAEAQEKAETEWANFIIIFDVKSRHHGKLEEHIMSLGKATRVLPGIWALHAAHTGGTIRNQLIEHFGKLDSLFIIDATRDKLAWFNLGPEADSLIRTVWKKSG